MAEKPSEINELIDPERDLTKLSADELKGDIEATRDAMSATIDAIQDKIDPRRVAVKARAEISDKVREKIEPAGLRRADQTQSGRRWRARFQRTRRRKFARQPRRRAQMGRGRIGRSGRAGSWHRRHQETARTQIKSLRKQNPERQNLKRKRRGFIVKLPIVIIKPRPRRVLFVATIILDFTQPMIKILLTCALGAALLTVIAPVPAHSQAMTRVIKPLLHPLFSENAVLQRDRPLTIWGWADSNADVTVKFGGGERTIRADDEGYWSVPIRPRGAGGPYSLEVSSARQTETRRNLMFGDVWLCSGQSNMEFQLNGTNNAAAEKAAADYPNIRLLHIPNNIRSAPVDNVNSSWQVCTPQTVGDFSAVGYFFGRKLNRDLKVPIGLIDSTWGGTPAEAWVSESALKTMGDFDGNIASLHARANNPSSVEEQMKTWWQSDAGTQAGWQSADFGDADWKTMAVPAAWEDKGYPDFDGVMWFRREITVPDALAGRDLTLDLGNVDDDDATYWNGNLIGETRGYGNARNYKISGAQVKAGLNTIAIRVLDTGGGGGLRSAMFAGGGGRIEEDFARWRLEISSGRLARRRAATAARDRPKHADRALQRHDFAAFAGSNQRRNLVSGRK